jgi:cysteine desulfurase/selenocysteine lyase
MTTEATRPGSRTGSASLARIRERIVGVGRRVPVLDGSLRPYVNLDNAASTPVLREVLETVNDFVEWYSSVHRGSGFKSRVSSRAYDDARAIVAGFVGANEREHTVIFGKNTSEALNKLSYRLPLAPDDVVLVSLLEHHSNDLPWRARARVVRIDTGAQGELDDAHFDRLLAQHAGRVKLVAVTGGSNVTGCMPDIRRLAAKAHAAGAQIAVDCAQLAPHRPIDIGKLDDPAHLDYVTLAAHKMYAPFGTGALIGRRDTFEQGEPEYRGGGTIDLVTRDHVRWADAPDRDEAGTPNVIGAVALAAAIRALQGIGLQAIAEHEAALTAHALERLSRVDRVRLHGSTDAARAQGRLGVIPFAIDGLEHGLVAAILAAEFGIGVRHGCFCAHPYVLHQLGFDARRLEALAERLAAGDRTAMPGLVRISFGMYNTHAEVDTLVDAIEVISSRRYRGVYRQDHGSGEFEPHGWPPADIRPYFDLEDSVSRAMAAPRCD